MTVKLNVFINLLVILKVYRHSISNNSTVVVVRKTFLFHTQHDLRSTE